MQLTRAEIMPDEIFNLEARLQNFVSKEVGNIRKDLAQFDKGAKGAFGNAQKYANSFSQTLKGFVGAQAIIGGVKTAWRSLSGTLAESIQLYGEQREAEIQLRQALGFTSETLLEQASALQAVTTFGDEATIKAQALVAMFVKEEAQIRRITPLIQDMAAAKGMKLANAADLVSKTLGSTTNALSRYGIQVDGAVGSTERLESMATALEKAFGGQAAAIAKDGIGPLIQFQNEVGDLKEELGRLIMPHLSGLTNSLREDIMPAMALIIDGMNDLQDNTNQAREQVGLLSKVFHAASENMRGWAHILGLTKGSQWQRLSGEIDDVDAKIRKMEKLLDGLAEKPFRTKIKIKMSMDPEINRLDVGTQETPGQIAAEIHRQIEKAKEDKKELEADLQSLITGGKKNRDKKNGDKDEDSARSPSTTKRRKTGNNVADAKQETAEMMDAHVKTWREKRKQWREAADRIKEYELQRADERFRQELQREEKLEEKKLQIKMNARRREREMMEQQAAIEKSYRKRAVGDLQNMVEDFAEISGANAQEMKNIMKGKALMYGATGAMRTIADLGMPTAIPFLGLVAAQTALNIAKINRQKFARGGIVQGIGGTDSQTVQATPGEAFLTRDQTARLYNILNGNKSTAAGGTGTTVVFNLPKGNNLDMEAAEYLRDTVRDVLPRALTDANRMGELEDVKLMIRET